LPSERQLAQQLDAGRTTIRLILMKLATEGMIRSEHGRGYFVTGSGDGSPHGGSHAEGPD
jgi:GntR family transcriptional regulator